MSNIESIVTANFRRLICQAIPFLPNVIVIGGILIFFTASCKKDARNDIPNVYVDIRIDLNNPDFIHLNGVGNAVQLTGGVKGIVVYRKSENEFTAYDRNCSYNPTDEKARVQLNDSLPQSKVVDLSCGSQFELINGTVVKGPATQPLKAYRATYDAANSLLYISNL